MDWCWHKLFKWWKKYDLYRKKIYLNILDYLGSNKNEDKINYHGKIQILARAFSKCIYNKKIKEPEVSLKGKTKKEKENYILDFFNIKEEEIIKLLNMIFLWFLKMRMNI